MTASNSSRVVIRSRMLVLGCVVLVSTFASAMDLRGLWNFDDPAESERRMRSALATAKGDDRFVLETQIARTYGLRGSFAAAREMLREIEPHLERAGPEVRVRYWLELGRTYSSATHPVHSQTPEAKRQARNAYLRAYSIAEHDRLDALAVDALHMLAFVDTAPADQLKWDELALDIALASPQADAKAWEATLRNNAGYALLQLDRNDEALAQFQRALELRERGTDADATWIARWMVARTLRALGRVDEALEIQLRLERERDAAHAPDPEVFEELALLYRAKGDTARAGAYASRANAGAR